MKQVVVSRWILSSGSIIWFLSKAEPESIFMDWFNFIFILFFGAFSGDAFLKMINIPWYRKQWNDIAGLALLFCLGIVIVLIGIVISASNFLGSQIPGLLIAVAGIIYFNILLTRLETRYRQLNT